MTEKQTKIIQSALQLFAKQGYDSTSTNKISKAAGVSEGLIFKHFGNKDGLLQAILSFGQSKINDYYTTIREIGDAKNILIALIELPFKIKEEEYDFWRLLYSLKWQQRKYDRSCIENLLGLAKQAFEELGYADPEIETQLLEMYLDGSATVLLLKNENVQKQALVNKIKSKYNLDN